jgi:hypothetical protein
MAANLPHTGHASGEPHADARHVASAAWRERRDAGFAVKRASDDPWTNRRRGGDHPLLGNHESAIV